MRRSVLSSLRVKSFSKLKLDPFNFITVDTIPIIYTLLSATQNTHKNSPLSNDISEPVLLPISNTIQIPPLTLWQTLHSYTYSCIILVILLRIIPSPYEPGEGRGGSRGVDSGPKKDGAGEYWSGYAKREGKKYAEG